MKTDFEFLKNPNLNKNLKIPFDLKSSGFGVLDLVSFNFSAIRKWNILVPSANLLLQLWTAEAIVVKLLIKLNCAVTHEALLSAYNEK